MRAAGLGMVLIVLLASIGIGGCAGPRPELDTTGQRFTFTVRGKSQTTVVPKIESQANGLRLVIDYDHVPDGTTVSWLGKEAPIRGSGTLSETLDVSDAIGAAEHARAPVDATQPLRIAFAKGKHTFDLTLPHLDSPSALYECLRNAGVHHGCRFAGEAPAANAIPNIAYFGVGQQSPRFYGAPAKNRDIDWVALAKALPPEKGKTCTMSRIEDYGKEYKSSRTFDLEIMREEIEILDRRTGTKLHTRTLSALDRCPITATAGDVDTAVKRPIEDVYRQTLFDGFRGQAPPAASSSSAASAASASASEPPSTKAKTKKKKK